MNIHPYSEYEGLPAWKVVEEAVSNLVNNQDLEETTSRSIIVGYLIKRLVETGVISVANQNSSSSDIDK